MIQSGVTDSHRRVSAEIHEQEGDNKSFVQQMFRGVFERDVFDEQAIGRYFSPSYVQKSDGTTLNFPGFVDHVREVKKI